MFNNQFGSTLRGVPQTVTGMSTARNYSTIGLGKQPFTELDSRYNLGTIDDAKRFANPNFVNKTNPNLYRSKLLVNYHSNPVEISKQQTQIEVGVDVLDTIANSSKMDENIAGNLVKLSSSPICISISPKLVISVTPESIPRKDRLNSDCCSEDSFIVFECSNEEEFEDLDDEDVSESEESDDEDTDVDEVDFVRPRTDFKKVRFNDTPTVHKIVAWDFAYRMSRKGHWEQYARDRCRFRRRIELAERELKGIFDKDHHDRMYKTRFSDEALATPSQKSESSSPKPECLSQTSQSPSKKSKPSLRKSESSHLNKKSRQTTKTKHTN